MEESDEDFLMRRGGELDNLGATPMGPLVALEQKEGPFELLTLSIHTAKLAQTWARQKVLWGSRRKRKFLGRGAMFSTWRSED